MTEEPRLNSTEIDNLDSRDVLKSRSTNARSVSPNDGSENHLEIVETNRQVIKLKRKYKLVENFIDRNVELI